MIRRPDSTKRFEPGALNLRRSVKEAAKGGLRQVFEAGQRVGLDILPRHYYSSVPDLRQLRRTDYWRKPSSMVGVAGVDIPSQVAFVAECCPKALRDRVRRGGIFERASTANGEPGYGRPEAAFLHCFVASKQPTRIIQVGAGVSTAVILAAAAETGYDVEVICIDPYPTRFLRDAARKGRVTLVEERAEVVSLSSLTDLGDNGMLFVDSTHAVRYGSEVNRIILEVLPRLPERSWVHFHDVFFPYDYPRGVFAWNFFPIESTLLHAFLIHNNRYRIAASLSMLHYAAQSELKDLIPTYSPPPNEDGLMVGGGYDPEFPSATYLRRVDG